MGPDLVGRAEIAERLGVPVNTVAIWRKRGVLPPPEWELSGGPIWRWEVIAEWSERTGHPRR